VLGWLTIDPYFQISYGGGLHVPKIMNVGRQ